MLLSLFNKLMVPLLIRKAISMTAHDLVSLGEVRQKPSARD